MITKNETNKAGSSLRDFEQELTFGEYVRLMLKVDNITQEEFAKKMGYTRGCCRLSSPDLSSGLTRRLTLVHAHKS